MSSDDSHLLPKLVSLCLRRDERELPPREADWDEIVRLALAHGVAPFLYVRLKDRELPDPVRIQLRSLYVSNSFRNEKLLREQDRIVSSFSEESIPVWPLKGPHLGEELYGDPAVRQVADIDLLVRPIDLAACDRVLENLGYARQARGDISRLRDAGELIYLRSAPDPAGAITFAVDLQQRLVPYGRRDPLADRIRASGLTPENLLLSLCVNQVAHRFARLKYLLDVVACLKKFTDALDWKNFVAAALELDFAPGVYLSLAWAQSDGAAAVPESVLAALRPGPWTRRYLSRSLGADAVEALSRGPSLDGPAGAFAILACTRAGIPRLGMLWHLLFPPAAYLRQEFSAPSDALALPLYMRRLAGKFLAAFRRV